MFWRLCLGMICLWALLFAPIHAKKIVRGVVTDAETGEPLPQGSVQIVGTYEGTITNADGVFELELSSLPSVLKVSYIGYQSAEIQIGETTAEFQNIELVPVPLVMAELVVTAEDMGPNIMQKVIAQKQTWWPDLATFQVRAYSRFTYRNETDIVGVVESLSDAYWDRERGWREIVKDKRETQNINWDFALPAATAVNLYDDEIEFGGHHLIGVTHPDALSQYDFRLVGRRFLDDQVIYDIDVKPKNKLKSAFVGKVSVLDSVYAMIETELTPNQAFIFPPPIRALGITMWQQFRNAGGDFWLPIGYQSEVDLDIGLIGLQFPLIKAKRVSRLSDYQVNVVVADSVYEKKKVTVDSVAVQRDSLMAKSGVVVPLTVTEEAAYEQIDSTMTLEKAFKPKGFLARFIDTDEDGDYKERDDVEKRFGSLRLRPNVWYNRVDGGHLGILVQTGNDRDVVETAWRGAYNLGLKKWAFSGEITGRWGDRRNGFVTVSGFRGTDKRYDSELYNRFQTSSQQFFGSDDYFDFFWNEGGRLRSGYHFKKPRITIRGGVNVEKHRSVPKTTDWSLWGKDVQRVNPTVQAGHLRSVILGITLSGKNQGPAPFFGQQNLEFEVEHSRAAWDSDFAFTQFRMVLDWRFKTFFTRRLMPNVLDVRVVGSTFTGTLPRERHQILDVWLDGFSTFGGFRTRVDRPYEGDKHLGVFWEHNFRTVPFELIGWQWAVNRNWGFLIHGAHGRTWFKQGTLTGLNYLPMYQDQFHQELGVALSGIFDLLRVNVTQRLDQKGTYMSLEMSRIF